MSFLKALLARRAAATPAAEADAVFEKGLRRIQRAQPAQPRYQTLFTRSPQHQAA